MNKIKNTETHNRKIDGRIKDFALVVGLALILGVSIWQVFYKNDDTSISVSTMSETEKKISRLLSQMDGVGDAEVMIYETEEGVKSAVVVCDGAKNFEVLISVREAVATALGTEEKKVKIYLKKD